MNIDLFKKIAVISALAFTLGGCASNAKTLTSLGGGDGDNDGDGVLNGIDECPNTRSGATVDARGCEIHGSLDATRFGFDSAQLTGEAQAYLSSIASDLAGKSLTISGFTDYIGTESYNMNLSERRAQSVANYLRDLGIEDINVVGYGETSPIANNETDAGRALNRRVEITTSVQ